MKASILIPAFNAAAFLEQTLESCVLQGAETVREIIVIDDHSEDTTFEVATSFAEAHSQFDFIIERNPSKGACSARNYAFTRASGEAIQWLDADDILGADKLQRQLAILESNPSHLIASKWRRFSGHLGNLYPEEQGNWSEVPTLSSPLEWLGSERMVTPHSWLGTRALFEKTGPWDESLLINQDGEYFTRAIAESAGVIFEPESRVYYRSGVRGSVSQFNSEKAPSLFSSCDSFERVALSLGSKEEVGTLISNKYQGFIYRVYPLVPDLRSAAEQKIQQFGKPTRANDVAESKLAKLVCSMFGWKALVRMRVLKSKLLG